MNRDLEFTEHLLCAVCFRNTPSPTLHTEGRGDSIILIIQVRKLRFKSFETLSSSYMQSGGE